MQTLSGVGQRVVWGLILLLAVIVLNFSLIHMAPGDPAEVIAGEMGGATEEMMASIRATYGLDRPFHEQLLVYLGRVVQGDLGHSFFFDRPVTELIVGRIMPTIILVVTSLLLAVLVGTFLGVIAARNPNGLLSHIVTVLSLLGYATPVFWLGMMVLLLFSQYLPWFPAFGMRTIPVPETPFARALDVLHHMVLPTFTLSILYLASYSRLSRASMLDVLGSDYIRTARSKGLAEYVVIFKHALKNAALPIVTIAGLQVGSVFSGAVLVETVFSLPGVGPLLYESILRRDYPVMLGVLFGAAVTTVVANIITDLVYRVLDPRIRGIS